MDLVVKEIRNVMNRVIIHDIKFKRVLLMIKHVQSIKNLEVYSNLTRKGNLPWRVNKIYCIKLKKWRFSTRE
jgi:hypothetical protein